MDHHHHQSKPTTVDPLFFCLFLISFTRRVEAGGDLQSFKYLGCYLDSADLKEKTMTKEALTLADCTGFCQRSGYPYAGLQSVNTCNCGMVYDVVGKSSTGCNYTSCASETPHCGGHFTNDVYYSIDVSPSVTKALVVTSAAASFASARMTCVRNGGDIASPSDAKLNANIISALTNYSNITSVWIGLYRKQNNDVSANYYWTDETLGAFTPNKSLYDSYWTNGDQRSSPCVSLDVRTGKWSGADCTNTALAFVCKQPPSASAGGPQNPGENVDSTADGVTSNSKKLALFIVLPLFLICYGGSCIFYCVHKIIKNCYRKNRPKMNLNQVEDGQKGPGPGPGPGAAVPPYRPLSAGKRVGVFPGGHHPPLPIYMPTADLKQKLDPMTGKGLDGDPVTARVVKLSMDAPPPKYGGGGGGDPEAEKRARLLENASRESRMRREKETDEGRAPSRQFTAPPRRPPPPQGPENDPTTAEESHGSTTQLLGGETKAPKGAERGGADRGGGGGQQPGSSADDLNNTPISEILKAKMAQKADAKKRPRKIITA